MSHSRFLLPISLTLAASGCSDPKCGIGDAAADGLVASSADVTLTFTTLTAGANNDCPDPAAPAGVTSLTIMGTQEGGTGLFTACVPRPDLLDTQRTLGTTLTSEFQVQDVAGMANNCTYSLDRTHVPTGTAQALNLCGNGIDKAGFILTVNGFLSLTRKCGATTDSIAVALDGRVAVLPQ